MSKISRIILLKYFNKGLIIKEQKFDITKKEDFNLIQPNEQIYKKCEEILTNDKTINEINSKIIALEEKFKKLLSKSLLQMYLQIDELCAEQKEMEGILLYLQGKFERSEG